MPNYTINTVTTLEEVGDVVNLSGGGTLPTSNTLVITPDSGYVLDAAGFSATTPYPTGVSNVTFANSTTAFAVGNVVNVTVTYADGLTMTATDLNISINICESGGVNTGPSSPGGSNVPTTVILGVQYHIDNRLSDTHTQTVAGSHVTYNAGLSTSTTTSVSALSTPTINALTGSGYANTITTHEKYYEITAVPGSVVDVYNGVIDISAESALYISPTFSTSTPEYIIKQYIGGASLPPRFDIVIDDLTTTGGSGPGVDRIEYRIVYNGAYTQTELDNSGWTGTGAPQVLIRLDYQIMADTASQYVITHVVDDAGGNYITSHHNTYVPGGQLTVTPPGLASAGETRVISFIGTIGAQFSVQIYSGAVGLSAGQFFVPANLDVSTGNLTVSTPIAGSTQGSYDLTHTFAASASSKTHAMILTANAAQNTLLWYGDPPNVLNPSSPNVYTYYYQQLAGTPTIQIAPTSSSNHAFTSIAPQNQHTGKARGYTYPKNDKKFQVDFNITKQDGSNVAVTKDPEWPDDFTNTDPATNGGTEYGMSNIQVTGSGTSTVRFTADGYRDTVGQDDVTFGLDLDRFIDVSGSTTNVSSIVLDTFPVASSSFNLTDGITVNSTILPSNATNTSLTWAVSGTGFTITPSSDTQSAVVNSATTAGERTVTATAADGSGVTGTINVTAVQPTLETVDDSISVYTGRSTLIDITNNDTTLGGGCTVVIVSNVTVGSLAVSGQTVTYTAPDVENQQITFTYKLTKSGFVTSNTSTVTLQLVSN